MSLPERTLAMNSKAEDFPTPVSPTRRMVYDIFALFFDVLMIPFLRDSTSLEKMFRKIVSEDDLVTYLRVSSFFTSKSFSRGPVEKLLKMTLSLEWLVAIRGSVFHEMGRG